ncbi:2Fe-2S iron-sulfur cluster-binding protein [Calothrix sp. CCY 0018]|uniref:2Fe-2S iron-sulfur cluster-binding protein n=1 Tax=Calothrix sp. CCY 0018 TaxID=3103864 RepID=UPI0039C65848
MPIYKVRLINPDIGLDRTIEVPDNEYILDIAEDKNIRLPSGCKQGNCSACVAKIISGKVDQNEQIFLQNKEIEAGYTITCIAYPLSDCTLQTHQEQVLYNSSLYFKSDK